MLLLAVDGHLKLQKFVIFQLAFLLVGLQLPLDNIFDLKFESQAVVVDRIQDHRIRHNITITLIATLLYLILKYLQLLLHVILDYFDARYYNIFKNTLPLIQIDLIHVVLVVEATQDVVLDFGVVAVLLFHYGVDIAGADA